MDTKLNFLVAFVTMFALMHNCSALLTACTDNGNCTADTANSECDKTLNNGDGECVCTSEYKNNGTGGCTEKGLDDPCSNDTDCEAVTDATCNTNCVCEGDYIAVGAVCLVAKVLDEACDVDGQCARVNNANCNTTCVCEGQYKKDGNTCIEKVLADPCTVNGDCAGVSNAACNSDSDTCVCEGRYKESGGSCVDKGLGDECSEDAHCVAVANANCNTTRCVCVALYIAVGDECLLSRVLGESCSVDGQCASVTHATCNTNCVCEGQYKINGTTCVEKASAQSISGSSILIVATFTTILYMKRKF